MDFEGIEVSKELPKDFLAPTTEDMDTGSIPVDAAQVDEMFDFVLSQLNEGEFKEMLENIHSQWESTGELSAKQYATLERTYINQTNPRRREEW